MRTLIALIGQPARLHLETLNYALLNVGGREIHALAGVEKFQLFLNSIVDLHYWPDRIVEMLVVLSAFYLFVRIWRGRSDPRKSICDGVLLLWLLVPTAFYLRSKTDVFPHYLIPLYPAPYLAIGIGATDLLCTFRRYTVPLRIFIYGVAVISLTVWMIWSSYLSLSIYAFVEAHDTPGGMGTPIGFYRQIVHAVERYAAGWGNRQVVVLCSGDDPRYAECPAVWQFVLARRFNVRLADYNRTLVFPSADADTLVLLAPGESMAADQLPRYAQEVETVWLRERAAAYRLYRLPVAHPVPATPFVGVETRFENGATLLGYDVLDPVQAGQTVRLALYWQIDALPDDPPAQGYSISVSLVGQDGTRYAQHDGPGQRVELWRPGDRLISWFILPLAAQARLPCTLRIGMYVYTPPDRFEIIRLLDQAGNPTGDALLWPMAITRE